MSSPPPVERFKGTSWEECQEFILAIRTRALSEGKQRDLAWMADFAATFFWHHALPWHSQLPEDVRQDWSKLETALLGRWPTLEDDNQLRIQPTPAAVPPLNTNEKLSHPLQGLLRIVLGGSHLNYYVAPDDGSMCCVTREAGEALHVRCISSSGGTLLEPINHMPPSWLAIRWFPEPTIGTGSDSEAFLTFLDKATLKTPSFVDAPWQRMTCTVLASGEVVPVWKMDETNRIKLFTFVSSDKSSFALVPDPDTYSKEVNDDIRGKLFIEPTD